MNGRERKRDARFKILYPHGTRGEKGGAGKTNEILGSRKEQIKNKKRSRGFKNNVFSPKKNEVIKKN